MSSDIDSLKQQLKSALRRKHINDKIESHLRSTERNLTEEISVVMNEINLLTEQFEALTNCISEEKIKIAKLEFCKASELCKMKEETESLNQHIGGFKDLFGKEQTLQVEELKVKEAEVEEIKRKELQLQEEQKAIASAIEAEAESIERECTVLKKRNNAMMLKLRRQLLDTHNLRQALIRNKNMDMS